MHRFEIWAPFAKQLWVKAGTDIYPMDGPDSRGWWKLDVERAGPGTDYGFLIDDDAKPYPDPRSHWQPGGVHELSRIYDHELFRWTDANFQAIPLASGVFYELHIGTFTPEGTFDAAIDRLDYLTELGVTHIELMPVAAYEGRHGWGYDGVSMYAVHEPYGGPDGLKRLINAAHGKGLAVVLDVVYNHFGPSGNYSGKFAPYLIDSHRTPWGGAINLEGEGSDQVRRFLCDNALMWFRDYHIDGLRLDAVHAFVDRSAIHFLEQLAIEVEAMEATLARRLVMIAESDLNDPRTVTPREAGGFGIAAQWSDDFHHALFTILCPGETQGYYSDFGSYAQLAKAIEQSFVYDGIYSNYRKCIHGRSATGVPQHRFLGYIQNHDQIGNRAVGDRISHIAGVERAKVAAAIVFISPFLPMLFQGEEWAASSPFLYFCDHTDPKLAHAVSEGRVRDFAKFDWDAASIPDPEAEDTFHRSKLRWNELQLVDHSEVFAWYRCLIRLRRSSPDLNDGSPANVRVNCDELARWLRIHRGRILVLCNLGEEQNFAVPKEARVMLTSKEFTRVSDGLIALPNDSVVILEATAHGCKTE